MSNMLVYNSESQTVEETPVRVPGENEVAWVPLIGAKPEEIERVLGDLFQCHPLIIEDCIKVNQRPKLDKYDKHMLIAFFHVNKDLSTAEFEHVIGPNYIITVAARKIQSLQETEEEFKRLPNLMEYSGRLLYTLLNRCVDDYTLVSDKVDDRLDKHERAVFDNPYVKIAGDLFRLKRQLHNLRRIFSEEKLILSQLSHESFPYSRKEADVYFIDLHDHLSRELDSIDTFRESITALLDLQINMKSDRMNEIMKTLTVVSVIFMPLTFIVGLYGMNFKNMPELDWKFGYLGVWIVMLIVSGALWWYYKKKKKWL